MSWIRVDGFGQYATSIPTETNAVSNCVGMNTELACPLRDSHGFTIERQYMVDTCVVALFGNSRPSTILRRVWAIVVNAVERMPLWTHAHVIEKILKRFTPAVANFNASVAVILEAYIVRVVTSAEHLIVRSPHGMIRQTVRHFQLGCKLFLQAPAAFRSTFNQMALGNGFFCTALAPTQPEMSAMRDVTGIGNNSPSTKRFSGQFWSICTTLVFSGMASDEPLRLTLDPTKFSVGHFRDWCRIPAPTFAQFYHVVSRMVDTSKTTAVHALYHEKRNRQTTCSTAMAAL